MTTSRTDHHPRRFSLRAGVGVSCVVVLSLMEVSSAVAQVAPPPRAVEIRRLELDPGPDRGVPVAPPPPVVEIQVAMPFQVALPAPAPVEKPADDFPVDVFAALEKKPDVPNVEADIAVAMPAGAVVDLDPLVQQFLPQFRQLTKIETHLVQRICKLSKDQRKAIEKESDKIAKAASKKYAEFQQKMMQGQWIGGEAYPDPRNILQDCFAPFLKTCLTAEQSTRYRAELERRKEDRKQVTIRNLVAKLDEDLVLTAEQRQKLVDSLSKNWDNAWAQSLEMFQYNNNDSFPNVPDQFVTPFLNKTQTLVWQGITKNNNTFWGGFGMNVMIDDDGGLVEVEVGEDVDLAMPVAVPALPAVPDPPPPPDSLE